MEKPYKDDINFDESIPMHLRKERSKEAYKDNRDQDIKFVEKHENSKKIFQKTKWRTIYEVIDADLFKIQIYFQLLLSQNVNYIQTNHSS